MEVSRRQEWCSYMKAKIPPINRAPNVCWTSTILQLVNGGRWNGTWKGFTLAVFIKRSKSKGGHLFSQTLNCLSTSAGYEPGSRRRDQPCWRTYPLYNSSCSICICISLERQYSIGSAYRQNWGTMQEVSGRYWVKLLSNWFDADIPRQRRPLLTLTLSYHWSVITIMSVHQLNRWTASIHKDSQDPGQW